MYIKRDVISLDNTQNCPVFVADWLKINQCSYYSHIIDLSRSMWIAEHIFTGNTSEFGRTWTVPGWLDSRTGALVCRETVEAGRISRGVPMCHECMPIFALLLTKLHNTYVEQNRTLQNKLSVIKGIQLEIATQAINMHVHLQAYLIF